MFRNVFKVFYFSMWRRIEKNDYNRSINLKLPSHIEASTFYLNENNNDYYNLIRVFKNTKIDKTSNPLIINIHGGGWALKNRIGYEPFYACYACNGYDSIGFSYYSMMDKYNYSDIVKHIFNVLHYIHDNHKKLNISLDNVFFAGDSAGGQLSLHIYSINKSSELQKIYGVTPVNIDVKGLILNHPVVFLDDPFVNSNKGFLRSKVVKQSFLECMFSKKYIANPHYIYVNPNKYFDIVKKYPPILVIASNGDHRYKDNAIRLHNTLDELDIKHDYFFEEDKSAGHVYNIALLGSTLANKCNDYINSFIQSNIKNENSSMFEK